MGTCNLAHYVAQVTPYSLESHYFPGVDHRPHPQYCPSAKFWLVGVGATARVPISTHCEEGIYMGFDSPSIIRYLVPSTGALLRARFQNCVFEETVFPHVSCPKGIPDLNFYSLQTFTMNPDLHTTLLEMEVQKILQLQALTERLHDAFTDAPRLTRIPTPCSSLILNSRKRKASALHSDANLPTKQNLEEQPKPLTLEEAQESPEWPRGRPRYGLSTTHSGSTKCLANIATP